MVSVIVPVFNVEKYLDRCLKSVVTQTYSDLEIILVNDGSTDCSGDICKRWAKNDGRIRYFETENHGLGPARNLGINEAESEYIIFVDSDDWWEPNTVEELYKSAVDNDADIVYMNFYYSALQEDGSYFEREYVERCSFDGVSNAEEHPELVFPPNMRMWSKLFRRSLFVDNGLLMPAHPFEDFPVMPLLILHADRISQVHKPLYHYFVNRNGNLTGDVKNNRFIPIGLEELHDALKQHGFLKKYNEAFREYAFGFCKGALGDSRFREMSETEFGYFRNCFMGVLKKYCNDMMEMADKTIYILGSNSNYIICMDVFFEHQVIGCNVEAKSRKEISKNLEFDNGYDDRIQQADYILVDLLSYSDGCSLKLTVEGVIDDVKNKLGRIMEGQKVFLLKLFLSEKHGVDKESAIYFDCVKNIRATNKILADAYEQLELMLGDKVITVQFLENYSYTYENTAMGCLPMYYNWRFHKATSEQIKSLIRYMK